MLRPARNRLSPWIERLISSYGSQDEEEVGSGLKAHVIGVGQISQSQAGNSEGPTGLLFLSDGVLQIPAILTASAWEHLQDHEDRECFTSLLNSTVCIHDYRLQFHMSLEQTKCRFFLSVGELATTAAGPVKDSTPCCTTLPSVRMKIYQTWRALLGQEDSQKSQCGFDLSELLGEWRHDCLQAVLEDIREKLTIASGRPTSPHWDVDRIRYKGEKRFTVPIKYLLIPEEDAQQVQTLKNAASGTERREKENLPEVCKPPEITQPSVDDAHWQIAQPAAVEGVCMASDDSPLPMEDSVLQEDMIAGRTDRPLSNPWDIFSPPCVSSTSSDASPEATSSASPHPASAAESRPDPATSTQLPDHSVESSYFPPYQKQEGELSSSPPSWLFDTQAGGSRAEDGSSPKRATGNVPRKILKVHRDGSPFSYSYRVCGQNLQDFSRFRVAESLLHWAVKYLVTPRQADNPADVA
uniref:Shelterin complex subunit TPP1/Est3 domain-containing protein n=1 Tax=Amphilophus citrinellus TaxID=61819 RepID=A0A3Q0SA12_AMPCI